MLGKTNSGKSGGSEIEPYIVIVTLEEAFKGQLVTLTQGSETMRKTCPSVAPYEVTFKPMKDGVWTASSTTADGTVVSKDTDPLTVWGTYNVTLESGFNFNEWLNRGRVTKTFASLDDVLADEDTVRQLMTVHASADYMIESIPNDNDFKAKLLNSDNALKWIGLRDYTYDNMDTAFISDWLSSPKWEYALKDHVPIMTANNAPYGNAIASSENVQGAYYDYAYKVFDGDSTSRGWWERENGVDYNNRYVGYEFANPTKVLKAIYYPETNYGNRITKIKYQGRNNQNEQWVDLTDEISVDANTPKLTEFTKNLGYYKYCILRIVNASNMSVGIGELQFYGRSLNVSVPTMSDNTTPYGEASAFSDFPTSNASYMAFDNNDTTSHISATNTAKSDYYLRYDFTKKMLLKKIHIVGASHYNANGTYYNVKIQGSNDNGNTWSDIPNAIAKIEGYMNAGKKEYDIFLENNKNEYKCYQMVIVDSNANYATESYGSQLVTYTLQLYGLDYTERDFEIESGVLTNRVKYIYDHGLELSGEIYEYANEIVSGNYLDKTENHFTIYQAGTTYGCGCYTEPIDMSKYNLERLVVGSPLNFGTYSWFGVSDSAVSGISFKSRQAFESKNMPNNLSIDISNEQSNDCASIYGFDTTGKITVTEWWLEK